MEQSFESETEQEHSQKDSRLIIESIGNGFLNRVYPYDLFSIENFLTLTRPQGISYDVCKKIYENWVAQQLKSKRIKLVPSINDFPTYAVI